MSSSNRRQRELAAARAQRRAARMDWHQKRQNRLTWIGRGLVAVGFLTAFFLTVDVNSWFSSDSSMVSVVTPSATPTPSSSASASASQSASATASPTPTASITPTPSHSAQSWSTAPAVSNGTNAHAMVLGLNQGIISIALDHKAPETVASMAFLSKHKYFDGTRCHRLTTAGIFVLQCGDPTATGRGGPGYTIPDENLPTASAANGIYVYPRGTVAMANTGQAHSGGSQFFLVYKDSPLPPNYTVWGRMTSGLDVLDRIANGGTADGSGDGAPASAVVITSATIH